MGVPLSPEVKKNVESMKNEDKQVLNLELAYLASFADASWPLYI